MKIMRSISSTSLLTHTILLTLTLTLHSLTKEVHASIETSCNFEQIDGNGTLKQDESASIPTLRSLLPSTFRYTDAMYMFIVLQPIFMLLCQYRASFMASLITNPHTSTFRASVGSNGLNFQTINMLVYHTTCTDRVLHTATFTLDAFAQASLAFHHWMPLLVQVGGILSFQAGFSYNFGACIGGLIATSLVLIYAAQLYSLGGWRLLLGMFVVWTGIGFLLTVTETLLFIDLSPEMASMLSKRTACLILMGGAFCRTLGHCVEHQNVGVVGNHSFMAGNDAPTWQEFKSRPIRAFYKLVLFLFRCTAIVFMGGMAEFNAGQPYRLFPVLVHLVMLRFELNGEREGSADKSNPPRKGSRRPTHVLMSLRELNHVASFIVRNGWAACTSDVALKLQKEDERRERRRLRQERQEEILKKANNSNFAGHADSHPLPSIPHLAPASDFTQRSGIEKFVSASELQRLSREEDSDAGGVTLGEATAPVIEAAGIAAKTECNLEAPVSLLHSMGSDESAQSPFPVGSPDSTYRSDGSNASSSSMSSTSSDSTATKILPVLDLSPAMLLGENSYPLSDCSPTPSAAMDDHHRWINASPSPSSPISPADHASPEMHSRHFSGIGLQSEYNFSPRTTFMHRDCGVLLPLEQEGYQVWGLWPELERQASEELRSKRNQNSKQSTQTPSRRLAQPHVHKN